MTTPPTYEQLVTEVDGLKRQVNYLLEQNQLQAEQNRIFQERITALERANINLIADTNVSLDSEIYLEEKYARAMELLVTANSRLRDNRLEPVSMAGL